MQEKNNRLRRAAIFNLRNRVLLLASALLVPLSPAQSAHEAPIFRDPDRAVEERAADFVSRLTLEEKVAQMQSAAPAIERLGIPAYDWWNEALHGVARAGRATVFPQAIGLAATWDTPLMHRIADAISTEARAKYNEAQRTGNYGRYYGLTFWSPNINIFRDPRWGRGQETYGEDPFLTSRMAAAFIQGMQGNNPSYLKTVATAKHFAVHSGPDPSRHTFDVHPSARDLEDTYLPAFRASIVEAKADSVMCAYNSVDGVPACANLPLLQEHLRTAWKFKGYVVSDCGAIDDVLHGHKYKPTMPEASAAAVMAGTDLTCGQEYLSLVEAVHQGLISEREVDQALERLFTARLRLGMFDPPDRVPYASIPYSKNDSPPHRELALQAARESIVLLKNDHNFLPLTADTRRITVVGPAADDPDTMLANYHGTPSSIVTPLAGIGRQFGSKSEIRFSLGSTFSSASSALVPGSAVQPSRQSDAHGLFAEYFANPDLRGPPVLSRSEPRLYLQREMQDFDIEAHLPHNGYSVRWSGFLRPPYTGQYTLGVVRMRCEQCVGDDSAEMYVDDKLILGNTTDASSSRVVKETKIQLEKGVLYKVRIEYRQHGGGVGLQFLWRPPSEPMLAEAVEAVKDSDVAIAFLGLNSQLEGEEMQIDIPGFSGGDRTSLDLPEPQEKLLEAIIHTGKPVVIVLVAGSAIALNYGQEHAVAILDAWYGGEEGGTAIAQTLAGENNPAGRLPVTFYRSVADLPPFDDYAMQGRTYRYFNKDPLYRFGYGLSYSTFKYSSLHVYRDLENKSLLQVSAQVLNSSSRAGDEVVELYVANQNPTRDDAVRTLCGIQRLHFSPDQIRAVQFNLNLFDCGASRTLGAPSSNPVTESPGGEIVISVGGAQPGGTTQFLETKF